MAKIHWESQSLSKPSMTAYLDVLREASHGAAAACQLNSSPDTGELLRTEHAAILLETASGLNAICPSDLSGGGTLEMPRDHTLLLALISVSNVFQTTFRLKEEPYIQFCDESGEELLLDVCRDWSDIAPLLRSFGVPDTSVSAYRLDLAITLGFAGEPLDIRSDRMPDAFF